jgi:hypothetical protein
MQCLSVRRVAIASLFFCSALIAAGDPVGAATILPPAQISVETGAAGASAQGHPQPKSSAVSRAALIPALDDNLTLWSLVMSGFALMVVIMRRRRRLPSVTH